MFIILVHSKNLANFVDFRKSANFVKIFVNFSSKTVNYTLYCYSKIKLVLSYIFVKYRLNFNLVIIFMETVLISKIFLITA